MSGEFNEDFDFLDELRVEPLTAAELSGHEHIVDKWIEARIMRTLNESLNQELIVSLECAKIMGQIVRGPDSPLI